MFDDLLAAFVEPDPRCFDCWYYDATGRPRYDLSEVPEALHPYVEYPEYGSGTNKFVMLFHEFASRAGAGLECGVWTGAATVPLAMGLASTGGSLTCLDLDLGKPLLRERIQRHQLDNILLCEGDGLAYQPGVAPREIRAGVWAADGPSPDAPEQFGLIYIDSDHSYEHTLRELFHFDRLLRPGGVMLLHDIVVGPGIGCIADAEDRGYVNGPAYIHAYVKVAETGKPIHISDWPVCQPAPQCLRSPIYLAVETFLAYRPAYSLHKLLDFAGLAIIGKPG